MKLAFTLLLAGACAGMSPQSETLSDTIRAYNDGIRWERYSNAAVYVPPKQRAQFVDDWDQRSKDLRITDYDVVKVDQRSTREARVEIKVEWYRVSEGTVRETRALQTWERHGKAWLVVDEERVRGAEMPGLAEPVAAAGGAEPHTGTP
jgi:hypothetical protein